MIEPLDAVDRPAYLLTTRLQAIARVYTLKRPNLRFGLKKRGDEEPGMKR
jgi:hydroxypyruvate isomerase